MSRILNACIEILPALPFLLAAFWLLQQYRFQNWMKTAAYFVFTLYLAAMYTLVGLPSVTYIRFDANLNFVPFLYMFSDWENSLLNLLLFLPLGFFLPVLWEKYGSIFKSTLFGFFTSLSIEVLQLFTFRATDVNDLITNTLGTILGFAASRVLMTQVPAILPQKDTNDLSLLCVLTFGVMFFLQPCLSSLILELVYR